MKTARSTLIIALMALAGAMILVPPAHATREPQPIQVDHRVRIIMYQPDEVYYYLGHYRYESVIEFGSDEEIKTIAMGDSTGWMLNPSGNRLFLKPVEQDATTNMMLITNKRVYLFELHARETDDINDKDMMWIMRFVYPDQGDTQVMTNYLDSVPDPDLEGNRDKYNFNYTISGTDDIAPLRIFDDGQFTYFKFKDKNAEVPAFFMVDDQGNESLINYRTRGDYIVIERVTDRFTLRHGTEVVCVFNEAALARKKALAGEVTVANSYRVGIVGGGAWGTALAVIANRAGSNVMLVARNPNIVQSIRERRSNDVYLPSVFLDPAIAVSDNFADLCQCDVLLVAVPSHVLRSVCIALSDVLPAQVPMALASKGIERGSLMLMSEVAASILPHNPLAIVSGPNFADEAARGLPTATTIACADRALWDMLAYAIGGRLFRPYMTGDMIGAQLGGAVKNVIAIACGITIGKNFGENACAALVTRGFAEMARLTLAKGGKYETLMGLSGLGDLVLTCGSVKSRNLSFGIAIGQGKTKEEMLASRGRMATEGVATAESVTRLARKLDVQMPICDAVYRILYENAPVDDVIAGLLERPFASEGM